ncbi:hypothetical protein F4083_10935 [Candidatus Poribacteria bacterium]|nr:hypothetical protein [Candidatus Poribacteria bacterium]MYB65668.1 hypothetical protein [Candidatus Poribacteria bacterium]MYF56217.1 hypothetical protein [Candidatus Poribacteria bacterium]MYI94815.1 hypothetical protein [Candidatus Poribacteria bacterium]
MLKKFFSNLFVIGAVVFACIISIVGILLWNQNSQKEETLQTSSNPLFADGVPAHLQCPQRLIGKYVKEITREDVLKIQAIAKEVVTNYNPKRHVSTTWELDGKMQLEYHAKSDVEKRGYQGREDFQLGANRIDWVVQSVLDYPEHVRLPDFHRWILLKREQRLKEGKTYMTSINPFFVDGVPEHLQCPPELIGKYIKEVSESDLLKIKAIAQEVWDNYIPKRSGSDTGSDIFGEYNEATMYHIANADPEKKESYVGTNRVDWVIQTILDFPHTLSFHAYDPRIKPDTSRSKR